ncbi:ATP-dependent protease LonB [Aquibacillus sp. 3ASR75-11]|uniref:endopeptidase La n=1 Tax=Terrihalobacillus insolitus TaxID=2950438 RepID=A0A9X3WS97_9BACI|nr:ATP-dependent protease LonB [Terrihalobacillus insolitus]MDC3412494.1 ATP-dependent protease LonB [Terrihalobacillus insolitus]MDC3423913.1 ATP-dependent protease LonB [Terrihalobacillus insolitus]
MNLVSVVVMIQLFFGIVIGLYFWNLLKNQRSNKVTIEKESKKELEELRKMRDISLSAPLSERIRPKKLSEIVGQEDGIESLRAAICGSNPQHVIIYGPPGVGKTAAARLVLEEAKTYLETPFRYDAPFVELDATTARFDERGIADPLIGSVHDPIYQGAGAMGQAGIPQPKRGAVSNAHGGILFIDEIGELHPIQMNKLLKVLEDRKVFLESAYYSQENNNIPLHIHEIFSRGLPADFRLVGATTRQPEEIPPAIRSRCLEIFFRELEPEEIMQVATRACEKVQFKVEEAGLKVLSSYARNGREAVNMIQIAASVAKKQGTNKIQAGEMEWVVDASRLSPRIKPMIVPEYRIGKVNGLAVTGPNTGHLLEIEVSILPRLRNGEITITGIAEEETITSSNRSIKRKSMARGSIQNVITMLRSIGVPAHEYDIHLNFPGGIPVDGPSAGLAMALGIYSSVQKVPLDYQTAVTGEMSIHGEVRPVGGIITKIKAAKQAGAKQVIIPKENYQSICDRIHDIKIVPVGSFKEALPYILIQKKKWLQEKREETAKKKTIQ